MPTPSLTAQVARSFAIALLLFAAPGASAQQESPKAAAAVRATVPPVLDGVLDEVSWQSAPVLSGFIQREPADGQPATERTEVRLLFDTDAVYVAVWAWDSQAGGIVPGDAIRDYEVTDADAVIMVFDTFEDEQNGFVFGTTPAGIEYDGQVASAGSGGGYFLGGGSNNQRRFQRGAGGGFNKNWDGSWEVATTQDAEGWYAEFRIPFSTLRYSPDNESWGFNMSRRVRRLNEEVFWSAVPREFSLYRLDFAGQLQGLQPPFRRAVTVSPYTLGSTSRDYAAGDPDFGEDFQIGGEAKAQITQGLTLDLTVNTDFAQVEVDDAQVNLTRFPLLFPEKRPFFLENAGFFTVGGGGADLFFSRKIGIDEDGAPVSIKGGGRFSGRTSGLNVGALHIQTEGVVPGSDRNAYSVARVAKELPGRSRIGGMFADRRSDLSGDDNQTYAVDAQVGLGDQLTVTSYLAQTQTPGLEGSDVAWDVSNSLSTRSINASVTAQQIGENFNPDVGFVPRRGHRYYQAFGMYTYRPTWIWRELRPHVSYFTYRNRSSETTPGFEISSRWHIDTHWAWGSGMEVHTGANHTTEGFYEPFTIRGTDVTVPVGTYRGWEGVFVFQSDQSRMLSFNARLNTGSFLSGRKTTSNGDMTLRIGDRSSATLSASHNDVTLDEGEFTAVLTSLKLGYYFTPRIYLQSLVQYSDQVDSWSANVRFGWLNTAGTGLFIVYNEVQGFDTLTGPQGRSLFIKFSKQLSLTGS